MSEETKPPEGAPDGAPELAVQVPSTEPQEDEIVIRTPIVVTPDNDVVKAAATMASEKINRLPVVEDGKLVGTISRADICHAVLSA